MNQSHLTGHVSSPTVESQCSLVCTTLESEDIGWIEGKKFSVSNTLRIEPKMPIRLNSGRIICRDRVNQNCGVRQVKRFFTRMPRRGCGVANLIPTPPERNK